MLDTGTVLITRILDGQVFIPGQDIRKRGIKLIPFNMHMEQTITTELIMEPLTMNNTTIFHINDILNV